MKSDSNFFKVWGGISGVQHTLPLLLADELQLPLELVARLISLNVAERFRLPRAKGRLAVGTDADLALVKLGQRFKVEATALLDRHRQSPYVGRTLTAQVIRTILRGRTVFQDGRIVGLPMGKLVIPLTG